MLARKSFLIFLANIVTAVLGVVSLFFVGRFFDPGPYGMFWFAMGLLGLVSALTKLGFEKAHVKRVSEGQDLATCMGTYITIKLLIIAAFAVATLILVFVLELTIGFIVATTLPVVLVVVAYKIINKLRSIPKQTFNALRMTATNQTIVIVENLVRMPLVVVVTLAYASSRGRDIPFEGLWTAATGWLGHIPPMTAQMGALLYAGAYATGLLASLVLAIWLVRHNKIPIGRFDKALAKSYWVFAWPIAGYAILKTMTHHIDMVMLGYFWTGAEVGFYKAAYQFVAIVIIIPTAVQTLFFPMISELISRRQWDTARELGVTTQRLMSLVMIPILMLSLVYAEDVFRIVMSLTWIPSAPALRLLVVHSTLSVFTTVVVATLMGYDRVRIVMGINLIGIFLNISLNFVFIPSSILGVPLLGLQMTGAALATVLSKVVVVVMFFFASKRILGSVFFSIGIPKQLISALITGAVLWSAEHYFAWFQVLRVWELAIASLLGITLYVGLLIVMKELGRKDILFFLDLMNPGQMGRYVWDELRGRGKR